MKQTDGIPANSHLEIINIGDTFIFKFTSKGLKQIKAGGAFEKTMLGGDKKFNFLFMSHERYVKVMLPKIKAAQDFLKSKQVEEEAKTAEAVAEQIENQEVKDENAIDTNDVDIPQRQGGDSELNNQSSGEESNP